MVSLICMSVNDQKKSFKHSKRFDYYLKGGFVDRDIKSTSIETLNLEMEKKKLILGENVKKIS